jgi:hypothetical protein
MTCFPIVLYPDALQLAWQQRPRLPELAVAEPKPPIAPAKANFQAPAIALGGILAIALPAMSLQSSLGLKLLILGSSLCLGYSLWIGYQYQRQRREWRQQQQRYEQQFETFQRRHETHQQLCGEMHHPMAIAEYQHQLVLAALQTATGYDKETPPASQSPILDFFRPYLERYFPGKIKSNLALYQSGCQDFHRCELAYIDDRLNLFIDLEIDEPYDQNSRHPTHCQSNASDGEHNDFFLDNGWVVMRFSEAQVVNHPRRCCRRIAQEIYKVTIETGLMNRFAKIGELETYPHWTWQEAQQMAEYGSRDTDLGRIANKIRQRQAA